MTFPKSRARELCERATPEEWLITETWDDEYADDKKWRRINSARDTSMEAAICEVGDWNHDGQADAEFIAESRSLLPAALARIERLEALLVECCDIAKSAANNHDKPRNHWDKRIAEIRKEAEDHE